MGWQGQDLDELALDAGYPTWERWVAALEEELDRRICGGLRLKQPHRPCCRRPGWGRGPDVTEGACDSHTDGAQAKRQTLKKEVLRIYSQGLYTLGQACEKAGADRSWIWRLESTDPHFRRELANIRDRIQDVRDEAVEDALFRDAVRGDHKGGERMFYLVNRRPGRWQHITKVRHQVSGEVDVTVSPGEEIAERIQQAAERVGVPGVAGDGGAVAAE